MKLKRHKRRIVGGEKKKRKKEDETHYREIPIGVKIIFLNIERLLTRPSKEILDLYYKYINFFAYLFPNFTISGGLSL